MSLITEILDRLSSVSAVKSELEQTAKRLDRLADVVLARETRIAKVEGALESMNPPASPAAANGKRIPKR